MTPPGDEPALLTRMSMRPSAAWACLTKFSASAGLVRSAAMATILRPVALAISAAVCSSGPLRRAQIATSTPSRASACAIALPMPSLPPVTSAVFPVIAKSIAASPRVCWVVSDQHTDNGKPGKERPDCNRDRAGHVDRGAGDLTALIEQRRLQRKRRKGGKAAENAGRQKQSPMLRQSAPQCKIFGDGSHGKG